MDSSDSIYFYNRAEAELKRAQEAEHPEAVKAHYTLAGHYLDRVYGGDGAVMERGGDVGVTP